MPTPSRPTAPFPPTLDPVGIRRGVGQLEGAEVKFGKRSQGRNDVPSLLVPIPPSSCFSSYPIPIRWLSPHRPLPIVTARTRSFACSSATVGSRKARRFGYRSVEVSCGMHSETRGERTGSRAPEADVLMRTSRHLLIEPPSSGDRQPSPHRTTRASLHLANGGGRA